MRRFWVDPQELQSPGTLVTLKDDEFHHLVHVSRLEEGERLELLSGDGRIATGILKKISKRSAEVEVQSIEQLPPPFEPRVTLVISVPRFQKMDLILQKCVELNAFRIVPVVSDRSFVKTLSADLKGKIPRWRKIVLEACKQSGRAWPMDLAEPETLDKYIGRMGHTQETGLFFYEGEGVLDVKTALQKIPSNANITCFVGAEGGFSTREVDLFRQSGFAPITLGPLVLRVETACITLLSVIQYQFGYMK